jgi:hypothetical protein
MGEIFYNGFSPSHQLLTTGLGYVPNTANSSVSLIPSSKECGYSTEHVFDSDSLRFKMSLPKIQALYAKLHEDFSYPEKCFNTEN